MIYVLSASYLSHVLADEAGRVDFWIRPSSRHNERIVSASFIYLIIIIIMNIIIVIFIISLLLLLSLYFQNGYEFWLETCLDKYI